MDYASSRTSNGFSPTALNPLSTRGIIAAASQDSPKSPKNSADNKSSSSSSSKTTAHVGFSEEQGEVKEKRERFLTAKYGAHQMALIRKRLTVEMWCYEELQQLYGCTVSLAISPQLSIDSLV